MKTFSGTIMAPLSIRLTAVMSLKWIFSAGSICLQLFGHGLIHIDCSPINGSVIKKRRKQGSETGQRAKAFFYCIPISWCFNRWQVYLIKMLLDYNNLSLKEILIFCHRVKIFSVHYKSFLKLKNHGSYMSMSISTYL